jgi:hypothetical protein
MPTAYVQKMAKKHKISFEKSEELWAKATKVVKEEGKEGDYTLLTTIYKKMLGECTFSEFIG